MISRLCQPFTQTSTGPGFPPTNFSPGIILPRFPLTPPWTASSFLHICRHLLYPRPCTGIQILDDELKYWETYVETCLTFLSGCRSARWGSFCELLRLEISASQIWDWQKKKAKKSSDSYKESVLFPPLAPRHHGVLKPQRRRLEREREKERVRERVHLLRHIVFTYYSIGCLAFALT